MTQLVGRLSNYNMHWKIKLILLVGKMFKLNINPQGSLGFNSICKKVFVGTYYDIYYDIKKKSNAFKRFGRELGSEQLRHYFNFNKLIKSEINLIF